MDIFISIMIYIISTILAYLDIRASYSKRGVFSSLEPSGGDIIFVFMPIANIILALEFLFGFCYERKKGRLNRFFRIKK